MSLDLEQFAVLLWPPRRPTEPILGLPRPPKDSDGKAEVFASVAALQRRNIEHAGRAYHDLAVGVSVTSEGAATKASTKEDQLPPSWQLEWKCKLDDYYGLVGLKALAENATDDDIKRAYRAACLAFHPDKAPIEEREAAEERFKALQQAYDNLSDPNKRHIYDSSLPFDDSIPDDDEGTDEKTFFKVYSQVFFRNEKFSAVKPAPALGDMKSSNDYVNKFYDFWLSFKSWRDYSYIEGEKIEEGMSRDEKRFIERENQKKWAHLKKKEIARIRKLVEGAMKKDPRMKRMREDAEAEKARVKAERQARSQQRWAEEEKRKQEEQARIAEEKRLADEAEGQLKKRKNDERNMRKQFRKLCRNFPEDTFMLDDIDTVCERLEFDPFKDLIATFSEDSVSESDKKAAFSAAVKSVRSAQENAQRELQEKKAKEEAEAKAAQESGKVWSHEELSILAKATCAYPVGTRNRWTRITEMVNTVTTRSEKEVIAKSKELSANSQAQHMDNEDAFSLYMQKLQQKKGKNETADAPETSTATTTASPAKAAVSTPTSASAAAPAPSPKAAAPAPSPKAAASPAKAPSKAAAAPASAPAKTAAPAKTEKVAEVLLTGDWSPAQQDAFQAALRTVPKDAADRWEQIAAAVPGKTKKDVIARFKEIRAQILAKKA